MNSIQFTRFLSCLNTNFYDKFLNNRMVCENDSIPYYVFVCGLMWHVNHYGIHFKHMIYAQYKFTAHILFVYGPKLNLMLSALFYLFKLINLLGHFSL
ncbi:hypothetical protein BUALT_Bualt05G0097200 [Buddleja alternifolia]|uniref:Uncharacterized protein n=1 Tax=Buddleja alternifolia TaxID=168488 RepID=A0AAV6XU45_9LAMI|nr:hypothetical protein BUALT_Bualt05G0097200 [Buddleja alternifolia]